MSEPTSAARTYLAIPFAEKDDARAVGARWDGIAKAWFVPAGVDLRPFAPWMPAAHEVKVALREDPREAFAKALRTCGLQLKGTPLMDGRIHRVPVDGDRGRDRSGAYIGHLDGRPAGFVQNFRTGLKTTWKHSGDLALDALERARLAAELAQKRYDRTIERERASERAAQEVDALWAAAAPADAHPYLAGKGVRSHGLRQAAPGQRITVERDGEPHELDIAGRLLVPVADHIGKRWSLQIIGNDGSKMFLPGGRVEGGHFVIGDVSQAGPLLIAEGYATAATVHELSAMPTIVAFNAGNLAAVAQTYRALHPDHAIYITGDNDHRREAEGKPNIGRMKAEQAAAAIDGFALIPYFDVQEHGSDWNDVAQTHGRKDARLQLLTALTIIEREQIAGRLAKIREQPTAKREVDCF